MYKLKIKLHPSFLLLAIVLICFNQGFSLLFSVISVLLHELGHLVMAKYFGYTLNNIRLMPYGAVLVGEENIESSAEKYIAIAGPIVSLCLATMLISFWWLIPQSYYYTKNIVLLNLNLFFINLLPAYPLDGARLVLSLSNNKIKVLKYLKKLGILLSIIFFILFIVSVFYSANFTLGTFAIFLFIGATSSNNKQAENYLFNSSFCVKQLQNGVVSRNIYFSYNVTLRKLLTSLSPKYITTIYIVNGKNKVVKVLSESDVTKLIVGNKLQGKIKDIIL